MSEVATVYAVFASADEGARIARAVIDERLAACVNILAPCRSIYHWQGAIEEAEEVPALFKTTALLAPVLVERIAALHSYDVPAAVAWPIAAAHAPYAAWIEDETGARAL